jgi:hypothetical protein
MISQSGIGLADPRLNLFRTAETCVSFQEWTIPSAATAHSAAHLRVNGGTIKRHRTEEQHATPSFDTPERRSATFKTHSLKLRVRFSPTRF